MSKQDLDSKIINLENQSYIVYLQLNSLIKQLSEKNVIDTEELIKDMDELNEKLVTAIEEQTKAEAESETGEEA